MIIAGDDDTSLFDLTDTAYDDLFWNTNSDLIAASPGDGAYECIPFDSGFVGRVRARESCGDLSSPINNDGELFDPGVPLSLEGYDEDSYDTMFSDSLMTLNPTSDFLLSVGASCQAGNIQSRRKFRARDGEVCKEPPTAVHLDPGSDENLEWGITKQGHPDYERLRLLPFLPGENNDDYCPSVVVGRRYAVCGPNNEAQDVIGFGTTLRNVHLCT